MSKESPVAYGFKYGTIEVNKMQHFHFGRSYREIAKHYKTRKDIIERLITSKQFSDIKPLGCKK